MAKKMSISFKDKEMYMYNYLQTKINATVYIKELILKDIKGKNEKIQPREIKREDLIDFEV